MRDEKMSGVGNFEIFQIWFSKMRYFRSKIYISIPLLADINQYYLSLKHGRNLKKQKKKENGKEKYAYLFNEVRFIVRTV